MSTQPLSPSSSSPWFGGDVLGQFSLKGRRALVTGAGRGIGQAIAIALAQSGAALALNSRTVDELAATRKVIESAGGTAHTVPGDLSMLESIPALVGAAEDALSGVVDIVVHSAGMQHRQPAAEFSSEAWARVMQLNLFAPFRLSQEIGRRQIDAGGQGNHIFIASLASVIGLENALAYNAAKSGVMGLVRGLSREWARHGIRVNAIGPGYVTTAMTADLMADDEKRGNLLRQIPMGRFGSPEDFGGPAVFLASDASRYMTGHLLFVDGGASAI